MPSLPATTHVQEDSQDARCASANRHRLPVPTRRHPPTPQPSAQRAHTRNITLRPMNQNYQAGFAGGDGYPPTGPLKECSLAFRHQAKWRWPVSRDRTRSARTGHKLTNWGTPRPHHRTPCDARQHGNRQRHSNIGLRQPAEPPHAHYRRSPATDRRHPSLPSLRFQALLTLFSGSFSSFPRGTCSLSVSRMYLALGETYHPLWAAFPSNPTLRRDKIRTAPHSSPPLTGKRSKENKRWVNPLQTKVRDCHPLWYPFPGDLCLQPIRFPMSRLVRLQFGVSRWLAAARTTTIDAHPDSKPELFPLRSPLLRGSLLVSFPPLNDMLKSSG